MTGRLGGLRVEAGVAAIGCLVPPALWTGVAVGAFGRAVSILHPDGALVSVVRDPASMEARAMMPASGWEAFRDAVNRVLAAETGGLAVRREVNQLSIGVVGSLDYSGSVVWDPRDALNAAATAVTTTGVDRSMAAASFIEERMQAAGRPCIPGEGTVFGEAFARLKARNDFPLCLVGFGQGTTPSGDDWLAGWLTAADLRSGGPGRAERRLREAAAAALGRTTAAGRALLLGAVAGAPPAFLVEVALAMSRFAVAREERGRADARADLGQAVDEALGHGATSGADALAGFVAGLRDGA